MATAPSPVHGISRQILLVNRVFGEFRRKTLARQEVSSALYRESFVLVKVAANHYRSRSTLV